MQSPFVHRDSASCLKAHLHERRGRLTALARELNCQPSYLSQVIAGKVPLSVEHALTIAREAEWSADESRYFLLLVQRDRAGSAALRAFHEADLAELRKKHQRISERIPVDERLSIDNQIRYYSSWVYAAIHVLSSIPQYQDRRRLRKLLRLDPTEFETILRELAHSGLVVVKGEKVTIGSRRLHLPAGSPLLARHHAQWKLRAVEASSRPKAENLHYSGLLAISRDDSAKVREILLAAIGEIEAIIRVTKPEDPIVINLDAFGLTF